MQNNSDYKRSPRVMKGKNRSAFSRITTSNFPSNLLELT